MHLNAEFAAEGPFKERVAHGMLTAGLISAVLGTQLPGPGTVYLAQTLRFRGPVKIGDTVTAFVEVIEINADKRRATLKTQCTVGRQDSHRRRGDGAGAGPRLMRIFRDWRACRRTRAARRWRWAISTACISATPMCCGPPTPPGPTRRSPC